MDWAPNWVKADPKRFPRVLDSGGKPIRVAFAHVEEPPWRRTRKRTRP